MGDTPLDRYETYYADKLWSLLPEIYRAGDDTGSAIGPLRELVNRFGTQAATLRRSIDRLWEDQSIESCDDWVIAYIADLLATNLVASLDARGQRVDVAKTIYYRRRKGTVPLLEELAANITGWDARVVEFFRRLGRNRHGLDPAFGWPLDLVDRNGTPTLPVVEGLIGARTRTPIGGYADLRDVYGARKSRTAFDELAHTVDVRIGRGKTGWHDIPHVGVFLWRLHPIPIHGATPVQVKSCTNPVYTFDPSGRDIPLFGRSNRERFGDAWVSPREQDLPGPIEQLLLGTTLGDLYGWGKAMALFLGDPHEADVIGIGSVTGDPQAWPNAHFIDPERGRIHFASGTDPSGILVGYHYGSPSAIGASGLDRRLPGERIILDAPVQNVSGGTFASAPTTGTVLIDDSLTYGSVPGTITIDAGKKLVIAAANGERPLLRLPPGTTWTFVGQTDADGNGSTLVLDGLWLCGCDVVLQGNFAEVTIKTCTIDPGNSHDGTTPLVAADNVSLSPGRLMIQGDIRHLAIDRSILAPITMDPDPKKAEVEIVDISDSIVQSVFTTENAIELHTGVCNVVRTTVLGTSIFHRIEASNVIFADVATALDSQEGCTRFSAYVTGSALPRRYECVELDTHREIFVSRDFGNPAYAQLYESTDESISSGADNGSEMGAYCRESVSIKQRSLLVKFQEYMPVGVTPVLIYVT